MRLYRFIFILIVVFFCKTIFPQTDTNLIKINKLPHDTDKILALIKISSRIAIRNAGDAKIDLYQNMANDLALKIKSDRFYVRVQILKAAMLKRKGNYDSALTLLKKLLVTSYKNNFHRNTANIYLDLANISSRTTNYREALSYSDSSLKYFNIIGYKPGLHQSYYSKALFYNYLQKPDSAILNLDIAIKNAFLRKDTADIETCYLQMGSIYQDDKQYKKAMESNRKAIPYATATDDFYGLGIIYSNMATIHEEWRNTDSIIYYGKVSLKNCGLAEDMEGKGIAHDLIGLGYLLKKDFVNAERELSEAFKIAQTLNNLAALGTNYLNKGNLYISQKKYDVAENYLKKALDLALKNGLIKTEQSSYKALTELYSTSGNHKLALEYSIKSQHLSDSIFTADRTRTTAELEAKYNNNVLKYEKEKAENEKLKTSQQRNLILVFTIAIVIILLVGFYFYNQKLKQKEEKKRLASILASEEKERTRISRELHDGLGQLLSTARLNAATLEGSVNAEDEKILETTLHLIDRSVKEVRTISHNLMPQMLVDNGLTEALRELVNQISASKLLSVELDHSKFTHTLPKNSEIAIYRIVQEVLNNMIKHANANKITITLATANNNLKLIINDNGKGFDTSLIAKSDGHGWKNILARLSLINGKLNLNSEPGKGTTVNIDIAV